MRDPELEKKFPKLRNGRYSIESPRDPSYNSIAFAVGNPTRYWQWTEQPIEGYYWPPPLQESDSVDSWMEVFRFHGYRTCAINTTFEPSIEKVAIFRDEDGTPTHVAKQDAKTGLWLSKLGRGYDITHTTLEVLEGDEGLEFGEIAYMMRRPLSTRSAWNEQANTQTKE